MTTDLNKAIYSLKKMVKQADQNVLNKHDAYGVILAISKYAESEKLNKAKEAAYKILNKISHKTPSENLIHDFESLQDILLHKKEKIQVMNYREMSARSGYFKNIYKQEKSNRDLAIYDVVRVPTQGGIHYSVVTKISKNHIECYPITTASKEQLQQIGCGYYELEDKSISGEPLYLTSRKTNIPYNAAIRSFVREYNRPDEIRSALNSFIA